MLWFLHCDMKTHIKLKAIWRLAVIIRYGVLAICNNIVPSVAHNIIVFVCFVSFRSSRIISPYISSVVLCCFVLVVWKHIKRDLCVACQYLECGCQSAYIRNKGTEDILQTKRDIYGRVEIRIQWNQLRGLALYKFTKRQKYCTCNCYI